MSCPWRYDRERKSFIFWIVRGVYPDTEFGVTNTLVFRTTSKRRDGFQGYREIVMILDEIVDNKREELKGTKKEVSRAEIEERAKIQGEICNMVEALDGENIALIAEIKRASPSRGMIQEGLDPVLQARTYVDNGAAAISVLTESRYFKGSLEDLMAVKNTMGNKLPVLRKDFIFDEYQIYESRAYGADCLLLIVALLDSTQLTELLSLSHQLGMNCLVEVHNEKELERAVASGARIIGVNNRDLRTFHVDLNTTIRLKLLIPPGHIVVSESGIRNREDVARLARCGIDAILVGETLVAAQDTVAKMKELLWSE